MKGSNKQDVVGRAIGLGQAPTDSIAAGVFACGFTQVPVIEYVTWTVKLPVADANLKTFGDEIDVLQNPKTVQASRALTARSSSTASCRSTCSSSGSACMPSASRSKAP